MTAFLIFSAIFIICLTIAIVWFLKLAFTPSQTPLTGDPQRRSFKCSNPYYYNCWMPVKSGGTCCFCGRSERREILY